MNIRIANSDLTALPSTLAPVKSSEAQTSGTTSIAGGASQAVPTDTVKLNTSTQPDLVYGDPRVNNANAKPDLAAILDESNRQAQDIVNLILPLVQQQSLNLAKVVSGEQKLSADPKDIEAAKTAIAPDGEFGVQKTAERILSFAKASIGDDPTKLDKIRAAVEQGFKEASDFLGGNLPDISKQTLKAIQTEFDHWKADGIPAGSSVSLAPAPTASK